MLLDASMLIIPNIMSPSKVWQLLWLFLITVLTEF